MRAFSRSPIRRETPSDKRDYVRNRRESPPYRREVRRVSPNRDSNRRQQYHRGRDYDRTSYSPKQRRRSKSQSTSPDYQGRRQSSSPDKSRTKQPRESRWDSHVKQRKEEDMQIGESNSDTRPGSGEEEKLVVLSKWVRQHSNNESE